MSTEDFVLAAPQVSDERLQVLNAESGAKRFRYLQFACKETLDHLKWVKENCSDIEDFWPNALHIVIAGVCGAKSDYHALSFLKEVELDQDPKDPRPFKLIFHFKENPYFTNATLTKEFNLPEGQSASTSNGEITKEQQDFEFGNLIPSTTEIDWKSDEVNLCKKYPRNAHTDPEDFEGDAGSFFYFFTEKADSHSLGAVLQQDILADVVEYFLGRGENCEVDISSDDDELDEEDIEDDDDSIDLEEERLVKKRKV